MNDLTTKCKFTVDELRSMTIEEAIEKDGGYGNCFRDKLCADALLDLEKEYTETKNPGVILNAIFYCAISDFVIPKWCADVYINAYRKIRHYRAGSWDDVFGKPHPKGTHLGAKNEAWFKRHEVYDRIKKILTDEPKTPIDGALFERVGRELGVGGKTKTEKLYYDAKKSREPKNL